MLDTAICSTIYFAFVLLCLCLSPFFAVLFHFISSSYIVSFWTGMFYSVTGFFSLTFLLCFRKIFSWVSVRPLCFHYLLAALCCAVLFGYMPFMIIEYFPNQWKYFVRIVFRTILPNILWHTDWERYLADSFSTHRNARISEKLIIITITIATNKREERLIRCVSTYLSRNRPIHLSLNRLLTVRAHHCMTLMFNCRWFAMCILCLNQCHSHNYTRSLLPRLLLSSTPLSDSNHLSMTPRTSEYVIYSSGIWILGLDLTFAFYRNYKIISFWICVRLYLEHSTTTYLCK